MSWISGLFESLRSVEYLLTRPIIGNFLIPEDFRLAAHQLEFFFFFLTLKYGNPHERSSLQNGTPSPQLSQLVIFKLLKYTYHSYSIFKKVLGALTWNLACHSRRYSKLCVEIFCSKCCVKIYYSKLVKIFYSKLCVKIFYLQLCVENFVSNFTIQILCQHFLF